MKWITRAAIGSGVAAGVLLAVGTYRPAARAATEVGPSSYDDALRFEVIATDNLLVGPVDGRVIVALSRLNQSEPRLRIGRVVPSATPIFAVDVRNFQTGSVVVIDESAASFPHPTLADLPPGDYHVQVVLEMNRDLKSPNAPGNLYSRPQTLSIPVENDPVIRLELTERVPDESLPADTDSLRFVRIRSALLTAFHGRPIDLRAGIILPRGFEDEPDRLYPIRVHVGGYGTRYTRVEQLMRPGSAFRTTWLAEDTPRMILVHLDGAGPYGDPYQVNSANNGPYGDAITQELISYIADRFRGLVHPGSRVVDGASTGGWVSLALQIFYPDFFNGAWSYCPDGIDFRQFQLVNIYKDTNAYVDADGAERASAREINGEVRFTMRHELRMENTLGRGNHWPLSGRQWGAWNAVYGPKGEDGLPVPLWDPKSGVIDHEVTDHWEQYDLRLRLAHNWETLAPKLEGKINIWVGEADNYYLNNAVQLLENFLTEVDPSFDARIVYGPNRGHCWTGLTENELMQEMGERTGARP